MIDSIEEIIKLAKKLVSVPSITPLDPACQDIIADYLKKLNFEIQHLPHPNKKVKNLYAKYGTTGSLFLFLGHTDVVSPGTLKNWTYPPFTPTIKKDYLYGRGTQDMKGSIVAMMYAAAKFVKQHGNNFNGQIGFLITSAEEGNDYLAGIPYALTKLPQEKIKCLVGEPSCEKYLGDTIRIGRRGSLKAYLTLNGQQGHVAYPQQIKNPIDAGATVINQINAINWCNGNTHFPPTTIQCVHISCDNQATNVTPGSMSIWFAIRYSNEITIDDIKTKFFHILDQQNIEYEIQWEHSGKPFLTNKGKLLNATHKAIQQITNKKAQESTAGGTSDGRFIAPLGAEVIEFGTCNNTIHMVNEKVKVSELNDLPKIYYEILNQLFITKNY